MQALLIQRLCIKMLILFTSKINLDITTLYDEKIQI